MDGRAEYDKEEYPEGLNAMFLKGPEEADKLDEVFGKGKGMFEDPEKRDIAAHVQAIVAELRKHGLEEGAAMVDLGAGTGLFLKPVTEVVGPSGTIFACEVSEAFCALLESKKAADEALAKVVKVVHSPEDKVAVPDACADLVLVSDVYHHLTFPVVVMKECARALRPGGVLVVIDFHRDSDKIHTRPRGWVERHVRADQATFRAEIESAGFVLVDEPEVGMRENYMMVFSRGA